MTEILLLLVYVFIEALFGFIVVASTMRFAKGTSLEKRDYKEIAIFTLIWTVIGITT